MSDRPDEERPLGLRELLGSLVAAAIGVQSQRNRERDFARGTASQFIVAGIVATLLFVLLVCGAVRLILACVGA